MLQQHDGLAIDKINAASAYAIGDVTLAQTVVVEKSTDAVSSNALDGLGVGIVRA